MVSKKVYIIKASGEKELFSDQKLRRSLVRVGASPTLISKIVRHIKSELREGMTTSEIYRHAFSVLHQNQRPAALRYNLKKAIMDLGPSGYPFEMFIGKLLENQGYKTKVGRIIKGFCVSHEIDVIAQKGNQNIMVECKFHNQPGIKTDVKVALYVQARFEDIKKIKKDIRFNEAWLVTNTKLTKDAVKYCHCAGIKAIGWSYPKKGNFQEIIENSGLVPLTCLTTLNTYQKRRLIEKRIILCREINPNFLKKLNIPDSKIKQIISEVQKIGCKS